MGSYTACSPSAKNYSVEACFAMPFNSSAVNESIASLSGALLGASYSPNFTSSGSSAATFDGKPCTLATGVYNTVSGHEALSVCFSNATDTIYNFTIDTSTGLISGSLTSVYMPASSSAVTTLLNGTISAPPPGVTPYSFAPALISVSRLNPLYFLAIIAPPPNMVPSRGAPT